MLGTYRQAIANKSVRTGGGRGIRTPERVTPLTVFKTAGFNHSPIPPFTILPDRHLRSHCAGPRECCAKSPRISASPAAFRARTRGTGLRSFEPFPPAEAWDAVQSPAPPSPEPAHSTGTPPDHRAARAHAGGTHGGRRQPRVRVRDAAPRIERPA